jgi:hypothetical protein
LRFIKIFKEELREHDAPGFHIINGTCTKEDFQIFGSFPVSTDFIEFLIEIGFGFFFGGHLKIIDFRSLSREEVHRTFLTEINGDHLLRIGNNGTTEGFYCLNKMGEVVWLSLEDNSIDALAGSFSSWIERIVVELFSEKSYSFYQSVKNLEGVKQVIELRQQVEVSLLKYDKKLTRKPGEPAILERYNRLVFKVKCDGNLPLKHFTVRCFRVGSIYGDDNVEYVSIPIRMGINEVEVYLFDPFNVEFEKIIADCSAEIDLESKNLSVYQELENHL